MKIFIALTLLMLKLWSLEGLTFSSQTIKNGETLLVEYRTTQDIKALHILWGEKRFSFFGLPHKKDYAYCLIPVPYEAPLGPRRVSFEYEEEGQVKEKELACIEIIWGDYKKERLRVQGSKVELSAKDQERALKEHYEEQTLYSSVTPYLLPSSSFMPPIQSKMTSSFGKERLFNKIRKSYHSGVDYRAKIGTPVFAVGWGRVVLVKKRFYSGLSVIIDHGQGIFSCYYHLKRSDLFLGAIVTKGSRIGLSGVSGRTSGPHLHFGMRVHGTKVNPLQLMALMEKVIS